MNYNDYKEKSPLSFISFTKEAKFEPPIDFAAQIRYNRKRQKEKAEGRRP